MSQVAQLVIKIIVILAVFIPYKFVIMHGRRTSFLQDLLVAAVAYAAAYGIITLIQRSKNNS
jgi:hypothetical protein